MLVAGQCPVYARYTRWNACPRASRESAAAEITTGHAPSGLRASCWGGVSAPFPPAVADKLLLSALHPSDSVAPWLSSSVKSARCAGLRALGLRRGSSQTQKSTTAVRHPTLCATLRVFLPSDCHLAVRASQCGAQCGMTDCRGGVSAFVKM